MKKIERIEQINPSSDPYRAVYLFSDSGKYISSSIISLTKKELRFYTYLEVNERFVVHKWLDNPSKLEEEIKQTQQLPLSGIAERVDKHFKHVADTMGKLGNATKSDPETTIPPFSTPIYP